MYAKVMNLLSFSMIKDLVIKILLEVKVLITIFLISFLGIVVFTNADMFWETLFEKDVYIKEISEQNKVKINTFVTLPTTSKNKKLAKTDIEKSIKNYESSNSIIESKDFKNTEKYLKDNRKDQFFDFNILPPTDRIIIPNIGLDVPVIDSKVNNILNFTSKDFDKDLMSGVVKYPTTPVPGSNGNTLLFGHTSQEWWKNNDYSTVFNKLPKVKIGDTISVVWEGKLYNYKMVGKEIVYPKGVEEVYKKYQKASEDYLTLMGCYPLGSARKRILIIAKRIQ